jgi:LuxR family maltose regulon positive regulatory protein
VLIANYRSNRTDRSINEVVGLLERLLDAAEEGDRMGNVIEILILQALAYEAQDNVQSALVPLERALTLAEPEGFVRLFIDEGLPMARLLSELATHETMPNFTSKLQAAFITDAKIQ